MKAMCKQTLFITLISALIINLNGQDNKIADFSKVPGTVVNHIPASSGLFVGAPSITIMPNGDYLVSHNFSSIKEGDKGDVHKTAVFKSDDHGKTWKILSEIDNQRWSTLFNHNNNLYLIGVSKAYGNMIIRKSTDGGVTWSNPEDKNSGLIAEGQYHCAPVPVVEYNGKFWRAFEHRIDENGMHREAFVVSAPIEANLLNASNWTFSNMVKFEDEWHKDINDWIEGNVVIDPNGKIVDIIRVNTRNKSGAHSIAAMIEISDDGKAASFDPEKGFIQFPGGTTKFTIRYDSVSGKYWSLTNWIQPKNMNDFCYSNSSKIRNTLALISSDDLATWTIERIVLHHPDITKHAFQYVDWVVEGNDIIAVSRTSYDDGLGGAYNYHDANFITFHRIIDFRKSFNFKNAQ